MNVWERAGRCVGRKPVKSLLLLLAVFVISLFLLSGMAAGNANVENQDKTRRAVGAGLLLEANETDRQKRLNEIAEKIGGEGSREGVTVERIDTIYGPQFMVSTDNAFETLRIDEVEKLAAVPGVGDYNITTAVTVVNPVNFTRIEDPETDQSRDLRGVSLIGSRDMAMDSNVLSGNVSIKEGRMVGREDADVCVVSEELAAVNGWQVGDRMTVNDRHDPEHSAVREAGIIGIYTVKEAMTPYMTGDTFRSENVIFTDLRFPEKAQGEESPLYEKAYFKVGDPEAYEEVKKRLQETDIEWERYDLIDNNGNYDTMSANFNELERMSRLLAGVSALVSFFVLFFLFVFWMKSRTPEIGIFLAMGVSKIEVVGQILCEAGMIAAAALLFSFAAAPKASAWAADRLVEQQVRQSQEEKEEDAGKVSFDFAESEQEVTGVSVRITGRMMLADGAAVFALTGFSVWAAGAVILRKSPQEILSEMS